MEKFRAVLTSSAVFAASLVGLTTGPAFAEGGFDTVMTDFKIGDESRVWSDRNNDNVNGFVRLANCSKNSTRLGVFRADFGPDTLVARGALTCYTSVGASVTIGDVAPGDYHFTVELINDTASGTISANPVNVRY